MKLTLQNPNLSLTVERENDKVLFIRLNNRFDYSKILWAYIVITDNIFRLLVNYSGKIPVDKNFDSLKEAKECFYRYLLESPDHEGIPTQPEWTTDYKPENWEVKAINSLMQEPEKFK